jgi:hypothetical protein
MSYHDISKLQEPIPPPFRKNAGHIACPGATAKVMALPAAFFSAEAQRMADEKADKCENNAYESAAIGSALSPGLTLSQRVRIPGLPPRAASRAKSPCHGRRHGKCGPFPNIFAIVLE